MATHTEREGNAEEGGKKNLRGERDERGELGERLKDACG